MTDTLDTKHIAPELAMETGETATVVPHIATSKWEELEQLLLKLAQNAGASDYTEDMVEALTWGRNTAHKQGQCYTTSRGHHGFSWGNKEGRYTCTKNADENKLYVNFKTWDEIRLKNKVRKTIATIDGYIEFLSESTPFEEEGVISRAEHKDFAADLQEAALNCGARSGDEIQVWGSNSGFYAFEFIDSNDGEYVTVSTREITPAW